MQYNSWSDDDDDGYNDSKKNKTRVKKVTKHSSGPELSFIIKIKTWNMEHRKTWDGTVHITYQNQWTLSVYHVF